MSFKYPVNLPFYEFLNRLEVKMAKVIHVRDDHEELVSFKPQKFSLTKDLCWLRNYTVVGSRFDADTEELFIKIV
jgi:hypothetical protein